MLKRGATLETVSAILGHASLAFTMDTYGDIGMDAKRSALSLPESDALPIGPPIIIKALAPVTPRSGPARSRPGSSKKG
jgi:hypothetical protein